MIRTVLAAVVAALLLTPMGSPVYAQSTEVSQCTAKARILLEGVSPDPFKLVPSVRREIAGYGRAARRADCKIKLECTGADRSDEQREVARQMCVVARDVLVRSGFKKPDITSSRHRPGDDGRAANAVYLSTY